MASTYSDNRLQTLRPSQWTNFFILLLGVTDLIFIQVGIFFLLALVAMLQTYCTQYQFNERTLIYRKGILNVERKELLYYRIKSISVSEPLWMRIFGLADVTIRSSDPFLPILTLHAVPKGVMQWRLLREQTHHARQEEGIREVDLSSLM